MCRTDREAPLIYRDALGATFLMRLTQNSYKSWRVAAEVPCQEALLSMPGEPAGMVHVGLDGPGRCAAGLHSPVALHILVPAGRSLSSLDQDLRGGSLEGFVAAFGR